MGERERGNSYEHVLHLHFILLLFTIITDEEINPDLGWQEAGKTHNIGRTQRASPARETPSRGEKKLTSESLFLVPGTLFWLHMRMNVPVRLGSAKSQSEVFLLVTPILHWGVSLMGRGR